MTVAAVWHYWLSIALFAPMALIVVAIFAAYVVKVVGAKSPRQ